MIPDRPAIRATGQVIGAAGESVIRDHQSGLLPQEPEMTRALVERVAAAVDGLYTGTISWRAKTLSSSGPNTEEQRFGADIAGILDIRLPELSLKKGFLAQAKRMEKALSSTEHSRLRSQCEQMLGFTSEAFVFAFTAAAVLVMPAITVRYADLQPTALYTRALSRFYEEHFECFIGERRINAPDLDGLTELPENLDVNHLLYLEVSAAEA